MKCYKCYKSQCVITFLYDKRSIYLYNLRFANTGGTSVFDEGKDGGGEDQILILEDIIFSFNHWNEYFMFESFVRKNYKLQKDKLK